MRYNVKNADHYCSVCERWIGNHNTGATPWGNRSYFSIIRTKYCKDCKPMMINQQTALRLHNMRVRNRQLREAEKTKVTLLEEENELLRLQIVELRSKIYN